MRHTHSIWRGRLPVQNVTPLSPTASSPGVLHQGFLYTSRKEVHNLIQLFLRYCIGRSQKTVVPLRPFHVGATTKAQNDETVRNAAFLQQQGKLSAFKVVSRGLG